MPVRRAHEDLRHDEVDLKAKIWTCPAEHMKARLPHRIPLSEPAIRLLESLPRMEGSGYVCAAPRGGALSDMTLAECIREMHASDVKVGGPGWLDPKQRRIATPHGMRSAFKDWCRSEKSYADEVSELALAHVNSDETRSAYARDELLPLRALLMADWGTFCATLPTASSIAAA